eukprot:10848914-Alexandrium_andersonii.AAC.1
MSASLVGSEMCIRDSSRRTRTSGMGRRQNDTIKGSTVVSARFQRFERAVSYTHLTLPTICSV